MSPILRPMLADVTDALGWCRNCDGNGWVITTTGDGSHGTLEQETCPNCDGNGCEVHDPVDALETLHTRGLWPWATEGEHAARWWCPTCAGRGCVGGVWVGENYVDADVCDVCSVEDLNATGGYAVRGWLAGPLLSTHLVAVASLGAPALLRAEDIVRQTWPGARVAWRAVPRTDIDRHHELSAREGDGNGPVYVFSHEQERARRPAAFGGLPAWPAECPWPSLSQVTAAWPALRALAAMGLHLLSLDATSIVLGVEALP